ncbi:MAG: SemiSWEET transporter [Candidatus Pacebacteria bacterium]|nr:SemiSWEET transporter [Candidatus Paceibacterota bacterium]
MDIDYISLLGFIAGGLTTLSFAPQLYRSLKTKSVADVSIAMYSAMVAGVVLWEIYAILINSLPLIITNIVSFVLTLSVLIARIVYGSDAYRKRVSQSQTARGSSSQNR